MENYTNLIRKIAISFSLTTGIDMDDLFQEANLACLEAIKEYNPNKGRVSTYVWHCVHNHLKNYVKEEIKQKHISLDSIRVNKSYEFSPFFNSLSQEAIEIARLVLKKPKNFICMTKETAQLKITTDLLQKGWKWEKICTGLKNLRQVYS